MGKRTPENAVKDHIRKTLNLIPTTQCMWWMPIGGEFGAAGKGDFVACIEGHYVCIEAKKTSKAAPTTRQKLHHKDVRAAGGTVLVIHAENMEAFRDSVVKALAEGFQWSSSRK